MTFYPRISANENPLLPPRFSQSKFAIPLSRFSQWKSTSQPAFQQSEFTLQPNASSDENLLLTWRVSTDENLQVTREFQPIKSHISFSHFNQSKSNFSSAHSNQLKKKERILKIYLRIENEGWNSRVHIPPEFLRVATQNTHFFSHSPGSE